MFQKRALPPCLILALLGLYGSSAPAQLPPPEEPPAPARAQAGGKVEVDAARGEVRVPCAFVNPSQLLEVFACHETGPTHETVLKFAATGPELHAALLSIGLHDASYWNGTSPNDFEKTQGDRVLVFVRWREGDALREVPAEGLLLEGQTGYPFPVRGFSFGARGGFRVQGPEPPPVAPAPGGKAKDVGPGGEVGEAEAGDLPLEPDTDEAGEPLSVEISLGAALRRTSPHSLLTHPTSSARLNAWMLPPTLDTKVVGDHRKLVEEATPATLIIRRAASEEEIVTLARKTQLARGLPGADALYDRVLPLAREIDSLKSEYQELLSQGRGLLEALKAAGDDTQERKENAQKALALLRRGRILAQRIEERYLSVFALEEAHKAAWLASAKDIPEEVLDEALVFARSGIPYEPRLAAKELELAILEGEDAGAATGELGLKRQKVVREIDALQLEREIELARASLAFYVRRVEASKTDLYIARLFEEDRRRAALSVDRLQAESERAALDISELSGLLDGTWESRRERVVAAREGARDRLDTLDLQSKLLDVEVEMRWTENSLESRRESEREEAARKMETLKAQKRGLELQLAKKGGALRPGG